MAEVIYDYTATEIQDAINNNRDFLLENNESRIVIEIPSGLLNMALKKEDGVLMAPNHETKLRNYLDIIAQNENGTHVLAFLRVKGSLKGTGVRGMHRSNISALLNKITANVNSLKNITDDYIADNYTDSNGAYYPYNPPIEVPNFDTMSWAEIKDWIRENDNPDDYDLRKESETRDALASKY